LLRRDDLTFDCVSSRYSLTWTLLHEKDTYYSCYKQGPVGISRCILCMGIPCRIQNTNLEIQDIGAMHTCWTFSGI